MSGPKSFKCVFLSSVLLTLVLQASVSQVYAYSGAGSGTPLDPFVIATCDQLQEIGSDPASAYRLGGDVDCSATSTWNGGLGFDPIEMFTGSLDGVNHAITNLTINRPGENWCGLLSDMGTSSTPINPVFVKDLVLEAVSVTCNYGVGGLTAMVYGYAEVINVDVSGQVTATTEYVGGIVGDFEAVDAGLYTNIITQSTFTGTVSGTSFVGGITGLAYSGEISYTSFNGTVTGTSRIGGITGEAYGQTRLAHNHVSGTVSGTGEFIGGLLGVANPIGPATDKVYVDNSSSTATVSGLDHVGGLVGGMFTESRVETSYASGNVSGGRLVGGLVGDNDGSYIADSYATGVVTGTGDNIGGITGDNDIATVLRSYATGAVSGRHLVGGLVGGNNGTIDKSYSSGNVSGSNKVGGLTGQNDGGEIINSYSRGAVLGNQYIGGLIGYNYGDISNAFSTGVVSGAVDVGGLIGFYYDGILDSTMYDSTTSGQVDTDRGSPKTTTEMKQLATFSGIWDIGIDTESLKNNGYPYLSWQEGQSTPIWFIYEDIILPRIQSVSSPTVNGTYQLGDDIVIVVTFSEAVTSIGNVVVTLETGAIDRTCTFIVSNSTQGSCVYTVQTGDTSSDLNTATISGTIKDQADNFMIDFTPITELSFNKNLVVQTSTTEVSGTTTEHQEEAAPLSETVSTETPENSPTDIPMQEPTQSGLKPSASAPTEKFSSKIISFPAKWFICIVGLLILWVFFFFRRRKSRYYASLSNK